MQIFSSAKAEALSGAVAGTTVTGISFLHDWFPLITEIATLACGIVALHGVYMIFKPHAVCAYNRIKTWKNS